MKKCKVILLINPIIINSSNKTAKAMELPNIFLEEKTHSTKQISNIALQIKEEIDLSLNEMLNFIRIKNQIFSPSTRTRLLLIINKMTKLLTEIQYKKGLQELTQIKKIFFPEEIPYIPSNMLSFLEKTNPNKRPMSESKINLIKTITEIKLKLIGLHNEGKINEFIKCFSKITEEPI